MFALVIGENKFKKEAISCLRNLEFGYSYIDITENYDISYESLKENGLLRADILICLTYNDSFNLYLCKKAKTEYNVKKVASLINCSDNLDIMKIEGIDFTICPDLFIKNSLSKALSSEKLSI